MTSKKRLFWASVSLFILMVCVYPLSAMEESYVATPAGFTIPPIDYPEVLNGRETAAPGKGKWIGYQEGIHWTLYSTFAPPWVPEGQWIFLENAYHKIYGTSKSRRWANAM